MTDAFIEMLLRLTSRERGLLALLVFCAVPAALWFGLLEPLGQTRDAARTDLREAQALTEWVAGRAAEQALLGRPEDSGPRRPIGSSGLEQSLISAGLRDLVSALTNRSQEEIEVRFDDVPFVDLVRWMDQSDPEWGYDIINLRLERTEAPGRVMADLVLAPQSDG